MRKQAVVEATCQEIYRETLDYFDQYAALPKYDGFNILQGPPLFRPPILFIGYQPGGAHDEGERERTRGRDLVTPTRRELGRFPKNCRKCLQDEYLEKCVGMNAIFLRSHDIKSDETDFDKTVRAVIENFCLTRVLKIIETVDPRKIVIIGLKTQELFDKKPWPADLVN